MGGTSPLHRANSRDKDNRSSGTFDLHSWQGLTEVLKKGKESLSNPDAYAEFRNLVLQYAQQGGDVELKKQIDAIVATFEKSQAPDVPAPAPREPQEAPKVAEVAQRAPASHSSHMRRVAPQFHAYAPAAKAAAKPAPEPALAPEPMSTIPAAPAAKEPVPAAPQFKSVEEYRARIGVIKRYVNAHVGNPVMLIDTQNQLGKKYMAALLAALKATGGGGAPNVDSAMANLEAAYAQLTRGQKPREETPAPEPVPEKAPEKESREVQPEAPAPALRVEEVPPPPVREIPIDPRPLPAAAAPAAPARKYSAAQTLASVLGREDGGTAEPAPASLPASASIPETVPNTARPEIPKTRGDVLRRENINPADIAVKQGELSAPHITEALNKLLHEWSIFSGSGFFGTGPGGSEHPLYLKLAQLSMGEVITGRWEGASAKITKIIKQYVDAWRHEQGIAYNVNETFEHYLRRVVQRILKRQNR